MKVTSAKLYISTEVPKGNDKESFENLDWELIGQYSAKRKTKALCNRCGHGNPVETPRSFVSCSKCGWTPD